MGPSVPEPEGRRGLIFTVIKSNKWGLIMDVLWNFLRMGGRSRAAPAVAITGVGFEFGVMSPGTIGPPPPPMAFT